MSKSKIKQPAKKEAANGHAEVMELMEIHAEDYRELAEVAITAISEHATAAGIAHTMAIGKITELAQMALLRDGAGKAKPEVSGEVPKPSLNEIINKFNAYQIHRTERL